MRAAIISIFFFAIFLTASSQEVRPGGKWWSIKYSNGYDRPGDTLILKVEPKEVVMGIYFSEDGNYQKMTGWYYCGTYVHEHHLKENPPIYENGKWTLNKKEEKTILSLNAGSRHIMYRVVSATGNLLYLVVMN